MRFDATDRLTGQVLDKSLIFNVEVRDKNDNAPRFSQTVYNLSLKETTNLGEYDNITIMKNVLLCGLTL